MRAVSAILVASLCFHSHSIGTTLAEDLVADGSVSGEGGGRDALENAEIFENGAAQAAQESEPPQGQGSKMTEQQSSSSSSSSTSSYTTTAAAAATATTSVDDAACSTAAGLSCTATDNEQQQQQQQQQQQPKGKGAVKVETGEQDGIRIEYVGETEGTLPETDRPSSSSSPPLGAAAQAAAAETTFKLLQCNGESFDGDGGGGGLTAKGVWNHLRSKLEESWGESAQRIAPGAYGAPSEGEGDAAVAYPTGSDVVVAAAAACLGQVLTVVAAPVSYLFGTLGGVPGWFSDVVFEVDLTAGSNDKDLPQRIVLVQKRPRILELACSLVTTSKVSSQVEERGEPAAAATATPALLPRLVREFCSADAPFPGQVVSRPCRAAAFLAAEEAAAAQQQQQQQQQPQVEGWVSTMFQGSLSAVGFGARGGGGGAGRATTGFSGGGGAGVCECTAGGAGPCTIRAPPGRDPCLLVELGDVTKSARKGRVGAATGDNGSSSSFGGENVIYSSAVRLRTYSLETTAATMTTAEQQARGGGWWGASGAADTSSSGEKGGGGAVPTPGAAVAVFKNALAGLWSAVERLCRPPSSVSVPVYTAMLVAGVVLLLLAQPLSESRVFHYLLSAVFGGVFGAAALVLRAIKSPRQAFLRLLLLSGIAGWLVVSAGVDVVPSPTELLCSVPDMMLAFWTGGAAGFPWAGKAFFAVSGLAGVTATRWYGLLLDDGDGWFNGQASIRRTLTATGLWLVYHGVSDTDVGMALVVLALASPTLGHFARRYSMWNNSSKWYRAGTKLSQKEYEAQGNEYTRQALADLRASTSEDWSIVKKLKSHTRRKMTVFVQNGEHYVDPAEDNRGGGSSCSVQ